MSRKKKLPPPEPHLPAAPTWPPPPPEPAVPASPSLQSIVLILTDNQKLLLKILKVVTDNQLLIQAMDTDVDLLINKVNDLSQQVSEIAAILTQVHPPTTGSNLIQTSGASMGPYSIQAGGTGTFLRSNLPVGSLGLFPGTVASYGVTDPAVTIGNDPSDPSNPDKFSAAVAATDTAPSFDVTVSITPVNADGSQGTAIVNTFTVSIVQVTPPGVPTTASDLTQTS